MGVIVTHKFCRKLVPAWLDASPGQTRVRCWGGDSRIKPSQFSWVPGDRCINKVMDMTLAIDIGLPEPINQLEVSNLHRHNDVTLRQVGIGGRVDNADSGIAGSPRKLSLGRKGDSS